MNTYLLLYFILQIIGGVVLPIILILIGIQLLRNPKKKVHRAVPILLFVISGVLLITQGIMRIVQLAKKEAVSVSIIGGADGPTSIFLAGSLLGNVNLIILAVLVLCIGIYIRIKKRIPFLKKYDGVSDIPLYCKLLGNGVIVEGILLIIGSIFSLGPVILVLGSIGIAIGTLVICRKAM